MELFVKKIEAMINIFKLLFILTPVIAWSQFTVTGQVFSKPDKSPLIAVSILELGTNNGTVTAIDGSFSLTVQDKNATLLFSYTGYRPQKIQLEGQTYIIVSLKADCNIDWFDAQQVGLYLNSGVINNPIGGKFTFTFPAFLGQPTLKTGFSYQTNLKDNHFLNSNVSLLHLFASCNFNADINIAYRQLKYNKELELSAYSIETKLNFKKIALLTGYSKIDYLNTKPNNIIESSGTILGLGTWIRHPFWLFIATKTTIYPGLLEYQVEVNKEFKKFSGFIKFYKVKQYNELSMGIGVELRYWLKNQKPSF